MGSELGATDRAVARPGRLQGIEGVRALAALTILVHHVHLYGAAPNASRAEGERIYQSLAFGVTFFFALSGFLLYRPLAGAIVRGTARPELGQYLRNRALRIVPAYLVILGAVSAAGVALVWDDGRLVIGHLGADLLLRCAVLVQHYVPSTLGNGIGPAWSLAVEVAFYASLPLLGWFGYRLTGTRSSDRRRVFAAMAAPALMLAIGMAGKVVAVRFVDPTGGDPGWDPDWRSVMERSLLVQADLFAFGMALAVAYVLWEDGRLSLPARWRGAAIVVAGGILAVTTARLRIGGQLGTSPYNTAVAFAAALVLALVVLPREDGRTSVLVRALDWRPIATVGLWSYSLFLWHEPLIRWLADHELTMTGDGAFLANLALTGSLSIGLSAVTYRLVEVPALRRRRRMPVPAAPAASPGGVA